MDTDVNVTEAAKRVLDQESQNRQALAYLLDFYLDKGDRLLVEKTEMGGTEAYVGSVSLQWLSERVGFASGLSLFREKIDPVTKQIKIDHSTINQIQQRPLDWSRQAPLAQYLAARKVHKFPPLLLVVSYKWVDDPNADEWDSRGRAVRSSADFLTLDSKGRVGLLDISQSAMLYALDGQHRLMAVRGLLDLIRTQYLDRKKKDGSSASGGPITLDEIATKYDVSPSYIQTLAAERIGVEVIAAVVAGETRDEARRRVRSIFVHVNRMAAQLTQGQLDQLNEDDGFSIVSRTTATEHPFLAAAQNRVEWSASSISERSAALTTLKTLREMAEGYLARRDEYKPWLPSEAGLIPLRPDEQQLEAGTAEFNRLWDLLKTLPSYKKLEQGADTGSLRRFSHDDPAGEAHMLFRPVGQVALANAIGTLIAVRQHDFEEVFKKLRKYDSDGGFRLDVVSSPWYMVLYDPNKKRMSVRGLRLAQRLLEYLLGGGFPGDKERDDLRAELAAARTIHLGDANDPRWKDHEGQAIDFDGNWVSPEKVELPPVIRA